MGRVLVEAGLIVAAATALALAANAVRWDKRRLALVNRDWKVLAKLKAGDAKQPGAPAGAATKKAGGSGSPEAPAPAATPPEAAPAAHRKRPSDGGSDPAPGDEDERAVREAMIEVGAALDLWGSATFIDARPPEQYAALRIPEARSLPWQAFEKYADEALSGLAADAVIVIYCDGGDCFLSKGLFLDLRERGYSNLRILGEGIRGWKENGGPVDGEEAGG